MDFTHSKQKNPPIIWNEFATTTQQWEIFSGKTVEIPEEYRANAEKFREELIDAVTLYDDELIALQVDNLAEYFKVASIQFLELDRLQKIFAMFGITNCGMCFGNVSNNNIKTLEW